MRPDSRYGEIYEFRTAIECWAVGLAAERIESNALARLGDIIDRMKARRQDKKPVDDLDAEFHLTIARACRNSIYYHVVKTILHLLTQVTRISHKELFSSETDQVELLDDHEALYNAISARDAGKARDLMAFHLNCVPLKVLSISSSNEK